MRFALVVLLLPAMLLACGGEPAPTAGPEAEGGGAAIDPEFKPLDGSGATPSKPAPVLSREEVQQQFLAGVEKKMLSTDEEDRLIAIEMLLEGKQKQRAGQLVSKLLMDPSEDVRATAAQALGVRFLGVHEPVCRAIQRRLIRLESAPATGRDSCIRRVSRRLRSPAP